MKFTILIPTRERSEVLGSAIRSCLAQDYENLEIIVSDNASTDDTAAMVGAFSDRRLRYVRSDRRLSMSGNFEFALSHVRDGYLMHLGDDDGLIPGAVSYAARLAETTGALAITSSHATYHWPTSAYATRRDTLTLRLATGFEVRNSLAAAQKVIDWTDGYPSLPGTYSSFVHRSVIDRGLSDGRYFHSITPDIYSCFANTGQIDSYVYSFKPFAVSGISGRSNGSAHLGPKKTNEVCAYERENDIPHHSDVVYSPHSLPIIVAEAFLQARDTNGRLREIEFDLERLCAIALRDATRANYPDVREAVRRTLTMHGNPPVLPAHQTTAMAIAQLIEQSRIRLRRLKQGYRRINCARHGIATIDQACAFAGDLLRRSGHGMVA